MGLLLALVVCTSYGNGNTKPQAQPWKNKNCKPADNAHVSNAYTSHRYDDCTCSHYTVIYRNCTIDIDSYMKNSDVATHRLSRYVMPHNLHKRTSKNSCRQSTWMHLDANVWLQSVKPALSWAIFLAHEIVFWNCVAMGALDVANVMFCQSTPQAGRRKVCDFLQQLRVYESSNAKAQGTLVLKLPKHRSHWTAERPCSQEILSCLTSASVRTRTYTFNLGILASTSTNDQIWLVLDPATGSSSGPQISSLSALCISWG